MELIFDSIEERDEFFENSGVCPDDCGCDCEWGCEGKSCKECWLKSDAKWSIKPDENGYRGGFVYTTTGWDRNDWLKQKAKIYLNGEFDRDPFKMKFELDEDVVNYLKEDVVQTQRFYQHFFGEPLIKPLAVTKPRHAGKSAAMLFVDEMHMLLDEKIIKPQIERVIFNDPATIVFWKDGAKTVVKAQDDDVFDAEKGLAMAICKKIFGNDSGYYNEFKKWLPEEKVLPLDTIINQFGQKNACVDCKYHDRDCSEEPCCHCDAIEHDKFEAAEKKEKELRMCGDCLHYKHSYLGKEYPCCVCDIRERDRFVKKADN